MLKKQNRLTKRQFDTHFKSGKRHHGELLTVVHSPADTFHGAVVVGKKIYKRAVDRNQKRRQIYNALYALYKDTELTGVFIVLSKPGVKQASFADLSTDLTRIVGGVLKKR